MSLFRGVSGKISISEETGAVDEQFLAHTTGWSVDSSMEVDSTPYFGGSLTQEGFTEKVPGVIEWTASIEGAFDADDTSGQDQLYAAHLAGAEITGTFYLDKTTGFRGKGFLDSFSISHSADGKAEFSASIAGNGALERYTV